MISMLCIREKDRGISMFVLLKMSNAWVISVGFIRVCFGRWGVLCFKVCFGDSVISALCVTDSILNGVGISML